MNKGTTVYHYSKGKGYILEIKERKGGEENGSRREFQARAAQGD